VRGCISAEVFGGEDVGKALFLWGLRVLRGVGLGGVVVREGGWIGGEYG
jgi:hypothetical protein